MAETSELAQKFPVVMRDQYGDIINITRRKGEYVESARQPGMRQAAVATLTPRFDKEGAAGNIIDATSEGESTFFRILDASFLKRKHPNSIVVEGPIPKPENLEKLAEEGKVITPAVYQEVGTY